MKERGFTLLELMTALVVVAILVTLLIPAVEGLRGKADRAGCMGNLRGLFAAGNAYMQDKQEWPQVPTSQIREPSYALAWIKAFEPYKLGRKNWVCPSIQRQMKNPDIYDDKSARVDYTATPFDTNSRSPFLWPTHPWFIERGDMHGDGNLILFTNGSIKSLVEVRRDTVRQSN
jgi:prepilin-type N-terminal cleavage/methylation domain-containing protein